MTSSAEPFALWRLPAFDGGDPRDPGPPARMPQADGAIRYPELTPGSAATATVPRTEADQAWERGHAAGMKDGATQAERMLRPALEALGRVTAQLEASQYQFAHDRERDLEGLALAVARSLVQREVTADPAVVRDLVARALECLPAEAAVQVRLHPTDLETLGAELARLTPADRAPAVQWAVDPTLERGSFMLESPQRIVDGRTDVALRTLYERLGS